VRAGFDESLQAHVAVLGERLPGDPRFEHISSSLIKEVARFGGDVSGLVSEAVLKALAARLHAEG
jgi:pantetheine-phosphate adenylyltransferase